MIKYSTTKSGRERVGILRANGKAIALLDIPYEELINEVDEEVDLTLSKVEKQQAEKWITSLKEVDIGTIQDNYPKIVQDVVEGKVTKEKVEVQKASFFEIEGGKN